MFYQIAGPQASSIDGPTEYSLYPSNVSAKLMPKDPEKAAQRIRNAVEKSLDSDQKNAFKGAVIIDANDIGRNVLGNASEYDDKMIEEIMRDNPMGQGSEQTPVIVCFSLEE
jgi:asparagine synthase (glutamine-hydrolysing)